MKESNQGLEPVKPVLPVAAYFGGKRNLTKNLSARIAAISHETYVEPFIGMGGVFLRRSHKPKGEVINDLNRDLANLFRVLQRHYNPLMDMLRWQITSRDEFKRLLSANPDSLTDLERAARFLYIQRCGYSGLIQRRAFGVSTAAPGRFDMARLAPLLEDVHARMTGVIIECLPWPISSRGMTGPRRCSISTHPIGETRRIMARRSVETSSPKWPTAWQTFKDGSFCLSMTGQKCARFSTASRSRQSR